MKILFVTWDGPQVSYLECLFLPIFAGLGRARLSSSTSCSSAGASAAQAEAIAERPAPRRAAATARRRSAAASAASARSRPPSPAGASSAGRSATSEATSSCRGASCRPSRSRAGAAPGSGRSCSTPTVSRPTRKWSSARLAARRPDLPDPAPGRGPDGPRRHVRPRPLRRRRADPERARRVGRGAIPRRRQRPRRGGLPSVRRGGAGWRSAAELGIAADGARWPSMPARSGPNIASTGSASFAEALARAAARLAPAGAERLARACRGASCRGAALAPVFMRARAGAGRAAISPPPTSAWPSAPTPSRSHRGAGEAGRISALRRAGGRQSRRSATPRPRRRPGCSSTIAAAPPTAAAGWSRRCFPTARTIGRGRGRRGSRAFSLRRSVEDYLAAIEP